MTATPLRVIWKGVLVIALPAILVGLWWLLTRNSTNYLNPPLTTILSRFPETWFTAGADGKTGFERDVIPSVIRIIVGYLVALVAGIGAGLVIGLNRTLRAYVEPLLEYFRAIPPPIMVPILILFLGIGSNMRIIVIAIGCVWPILLNTVEGVRAIDPVLRDTAKTYRLGRWNRLWHLTLPGASPQIVTGARQALSIGIILMVISEMFAGTDGLGFTIVGFQRSFAIPEMWSGVILLGLLGVLFSLIFRAVSGRVLSWYHGYLQSQRGGA